MKNKPKNNSRRNLIIILFAGVFLCTLAALLCIGLFAPPESAKPPSSQKAALTSASDILYVGGVSVTKEEYQLLARRYRGTVLSGYASDQIAREDFWTAEENGRTPLNALQDLVEEELRRNIAVKEMSREEGLTADFSFQDVKAKLLEENERRGEALENQEILYGVSSFDLSSFYQYLYSDLETKLIYALVKKESVGEAEIRARYEEDKDSKYAYEAEITAVTAELEASSLLGEEEAVRMLREIGEKLKQNPSLEECKQAYPEVVFTELTMNSLDTKEGKSGAYASRWETALTLQPGQVSDVYESAGGSAVLYCAARTDHAYADYEEQKGVIEAEIKTQRVKQGILEKARGLEASYRQENLDQAALEVLQKQ